MSIDIKKTQQNLITKGCNPAGVDGTLGPMTILAILGYASGRQPDAIMKMIATHLSTIGVGYGLFASPERLSEFVAETNTETGGYKVFEENMRYSATRLMQVWPNRFKTLASALPYAWDPSDPDREDIALADLVYGSRMGNEVNGTNDDDGWNDRGGGMFQHTGLAEYQRLAKDVGVTPEQVHTDPKSMVLAACSFWKYIDANSYVDHNDFTSLRKRVNGGTNGLPEITATRNKLLTVIARS